MKGRRGEGRSGRVPGAIATAAVALTVALAAAPGELRGQRLAEYDYENLRLRGVSGDVFVVSPTDHDTGVGLGLRLDLGFLGPRVRVAPRFAFWDSQLDAEEVNRLETRLEDLVEEQNPGQPRPTIDLGTIDREAFLFGSDLHWLPLVEEPVRPYLGVGAELYILNGTGSAIEGTFVEDGLDLVTAGVSGVVGLEVEVQRGFLLYGELRGALVADVRNVSIGFGIGYVTP